MKKIISFILMFFLPINVFALSDTAKSSILVDMDSGRVLYEKNADEQKLIASTTKIMTFIITVEQEKDVEKTITVGDEVLKMYGSNIYIEVGEKIKIKDLLYGLILRSGNDAAVALATSVSKDEKEFVKLMNKKAKELNMTNTIFNNCHGLDDDTKNYSTARDMAKLSKYANGIELYRKISNTKKYNTKTNIKSYEWYNRNKLLTQYKYATGGKNGYTPDAGRTLVTTASNDDLNLTIVTLNDYNEYITHKSLYEYAFNKYKNYKVLDKKNFNLKNQKIKNAYIKEDFYYPMTDEESRNIKTKIKITKLNNYKNNDVIGNISVYLNDNKIYKTNIYIEKKNNTKLKKWFQNTFKKT